MAGQDITVIRGGMVLNPGGSRAEPADILVDGDCIAEIGPPGLAAPAGASVRDAADRLLIPGLINAHTHGHGSLGKGMGDRWPLELLINAGPWMTGGRGVEEKYLAAKLNAADMIARGCTAAYDLYSEFPLATLDGMAAAARGYTDVGARVVLAPMMADTTFYEAIPGLRDALPEALGKQVDDVRMAPAEAHLEACRALLQGWDGAPTAAGLALAPTIPLHCSDAFITGCDRLAKEYGVGLHMHLAESKTQAVSGLTRYGKTLTAHLDEIGFLRPGFTGAHCIWLDADDIARLADNGCAIAHNPGSNLRLGSGVAPARDILTSGITLGVGTDGSSCSDNQNMFEAMRLASFVSRVRGPDPMAWLETSEVFRMATEGSAAVLGWGGQLGRLAPGYLADIVFLDLGAPAFVPLNDPVNQVVHAEDGGGVRDVMVGGRMVLEDRVFTQFDYAALRAAVAAATARLAEATVAMKTLAMALENHVGQYCIGLARQPYPINHLIG